MGHHPSTVSYYVVGKKHFFTLTDANMVLWQKEIDNRFDVYDLVVGEQYVYFCGRDTVTDRGLFGWFDATGDWGNDPYYYYNNFISGVDSTDPSDPITLYITKYKELLLIEETDSVRLVLVGEDDKSQGCVVRMAGELPLTVNGWQYTSGLSSLGLETFEHLTMSNNYVITGGTYDHTVTQTYHRFFEINNIFSSSGIQDYLYCYSAQASSPSDNVFFNYPIGDFAMTSTIEDQFVILCRFERSGPLVPHYEGFMLLVFDANQAMSQTGQDQVEEAHLFNYTHIDVNGLRFCQGMSRICGLVDAKPFGHTQSFLLETPSPFGTSIDVYYDGNLTNLYQSMDRYGIGQDMIALGTKGLNSPVLTYYYHPINSAGECTSKLTLPILKDERFSEKHHYYPLLLYSAPFELFEMIPSSSEMLNEIRCPQE